MYGWWRRLLELVSPGRIDRETVEELAHHVELATSRKRESGLDHREARRQALADVGGIAPARQQIAEGRTGFALEQMARELRWAARVLRRSPGISLLSIGTLAVGIGASAMLFALVDGIVLRPLPYPDPDRLVRIFDTNPEAGVDRAGAASGNIADWRRRAGGVFEGVAGYYAMGRTVSVGDEADALIGAQVTAGFFDVFGVPAAIGRTFTEEETRRASFSTAAAPVGPDPVVVLSHGMWMQRFGGDPGAVGRMLDARAAAVPCCRGHAAPVRDARCRRPALDSVARRQRWSARPALPRRRRAHQARCVDRERRATPEHGRSRPRCRVSRHQSRLERPGVAGGAGNRGRASAPRCGSSSVRWGLCSSSPAPMSRSCRSSAASTAAVKRPFGWRSAHRACGCSARSSGKPRGSRCWEASAERPSPPPAFDCCLRWPPSFRGSMRLASTGARSPS